MVMVNSCFIASQSMIIAILWLLVPITVLDMIKSLVVYKFVCTLDIIGQIFVMIFVYNIVLVTHSIMLPYLVMTRLLMLIIMTIPVMVVFLGIFFFFFWTYLRYFIVCSIVVGVIPTQNSSYESTRLCPF